MVLLTISLGRQVRDACAATKYGLLSGLGRGDRDEGSTLSLLAEIAVSRAGYPCKRSSFRQKRTRGNSLQGDGKRLFSVLL